MSYLVLRNLSKDFGRIKAVIDVSLELSQGEFCVILGPSGCGKSTLLNLIAGLEEPTNGHILLDGKDITEVAPSKRDIAMVFQNYALYPHLTVYENIAFGLRARRYPKEQIHKKVLDVSRILGIEDKLRCYPKELSGGQRQRVATGRAIVREPKLFLFDEPLSNLDARLRVELRGEFLKLHRQLRKTVVYVTHDQTEALALGDCILVLKDGMVQQFGNPRDLYDRPQNLFVAGFIGFPPMNILKGRLEFSKDIPFFVAEKLRIQLPGNFTSYLKRSFYDEIYLGIRPSHLKVVNENGGILGAEVIFVETGGDVSYANVKVSDFIEFKVKVGEQMTIKPSQKLRLSIDFDYIHLFDKDGKRIPKP